MATILGSGKYRYRVVEDWAKVPDGWSMPDAAAVAVRKAGGQVREQGITECEPEHAKQCRRGGSAAVDLSGRRRSARRGR